MAIKVSELREARRQNTKGVQIVEHNGLKIEVKPTLSVAEKLELANAIYNSATDVIDGITVLDGNSLHIAKVYFIVKSYTNITLPKDYFESYDTIYELGIYDAIKPGIEAEVESIETMIRNIANREEGFEAKKRQLGYVVENLVSSVKSMDLNSLLEKTGLDIEGLKGLAENEGK